MKFNKLFIIILIFLSTFLYSEQFSIHDFIKVKIIKVGKKEGEISWQPSVAGGVSGPISFAISQNKIFIPDSYNYRINIYDYNFNYIDMLNNAESNYIYFPNNLKLDKNSSLVAYISGFGLIKMNLNCKNIFYISYYNLPKQVANERNYFPLNNEIFIYNSQNKIAYINADGHIVETKQAIEILNKLSIEDELSQNSSSSIIRLPEKLKQIIVELRNDGDLLILNDKFYSTDFFKTMDYFNKIKDIRNYIIKEKEKIYGYKGKINIDFKNTGLNFIDYDMDHNSYWEMMDNDFSKDIMNTAIVVFSKYGELLDVFYYSQIKRGKDGFFHDYFKNYPTSGAVIAIAPNGDVYFMVGNEKEYTFYKVKRAW
ncbi:MAG: hypothetical protein P8X42_04155 [Calditrichaceae bacterium]